MSFYDSSNWYWSVAGNETRVWSSAAVSYVDVSNEIYAAWLSLGNSPTRIASEAELEAVLVEQYPAGWGPTESSVRAKRNQILEQWDWVTQRHVEQTNASTATSLTSEQYQTWLSYRQALRDLTQQAGFPSSVIWPTAPAEPAVAQ
ncbi:tail fiber assembly protein [Paraburkholderia terricola]|uniref:tail fiber assembly protein n=1 Tax=Paraburkholderia terricola TaxID=169427 RepID=UPI003F500A43